MVRTGMRGSLFFFLGWRIPNLTGLSEQTDLSRVKYWHVIAVAQIRGNQAMNCACLDKWNLPSGPAPIAPTWTQEGVESIFSTYASLVMSISLSFCSSKIAESVQMEISVLSRSDCTSGNDTCGTTPKQRHNSEARALCCQNHGNRDTHWAARSNNSDSCAAL